MGSKLLSKRAQILALHGFTGCGSDFEGLSKLSGSGLEWHFPDLPGHAAKPLLNCSPSAIIDFINGQELGKPRVLIGYSMGARAALLHALTYPNYWEAVILISGTAGIESEAERVERRQQDGLLAQRIRQEGVSEFLDYWQQTPLIKSQQNIRSDWLKTMQANRDKHSAEGLAASLEAFGQGSYPNLWSHLGKLHCPVLLIAGGQDVKYCALAKRLGEQLPNAQWKTVHNCGHSPHLESPEQTASLIQDFRNTLFKEAQNGTI